ncbi:MAG: undecaprenyl/decaprenyl-phosphate alpha-N-acetylglucosaminyl 1-phosphate transferase [Muribaculaceae bacterium]|nr:undecaprenyl/decaprenyl-phosphate alpha-N-acetylglucosaminyl 1-phosphate transferase [Muribaculaceae bacterium]
MYWIYNYIICLLVALILARVIIPSIMSIAFKRQLFDEVDERKIHRGSVPRLGGISFLPALLFSFCVVIGCNIRLGMPGIWGAVSGPIVPIFFLLCALMLMYLVGIADDLIGVRYSAKFFFQIVAGVLIVMSGCWIHDLYGFLWIHEWPTILGWGATIFVVIYVVNAINLIDGIDGLASGLSAIALGFYSWLFFKAGEYTYSLLAGAALGTLIPFFCYNVYGNAERHTKIFMGDTGALTIGTVLSFLMIRVFDIPQEAIHSESNLLVLAIAPLILPCFDVVRVFFHRVRRGRNPFLPDKCHIHHKLLALTEQRQSLIIILFTDLVLVLLNVWISALGVQPTWIVLGDLVLWSVANVVLTSLIRRKERRRNIKLYD